MLKLIGIVIPLFIDMINRKIENKDLRFIVSFLVCVLVGIVVNLVENNGFTHPTWLAAFDSVSESILAIFGLAQLSYKSWYEDSRMQENIRGPEAMMLKDQQS